jgi:parallel beta-helix repeat protein
MLLTVILLTSSFFASLTSSESSQSTPGTRGRADIYWNATEVHFITENYVIPVGSTLNIEAGASIVFEGPYSIFIEGSLLADGSIGNPILFTSGEDYETPGDWGSVQFNSTSGTTSSISYSVLEYAEVGIRCEGSSPSIRNNNITKTLFSAIHSINSNSAIENNSIFENNGHGIRSVGSNLILYGNTISDNGWDGVIIEASVSPYLTKNVITSNGYDGVHIYGSEVDIVSNEISFNEHNGVLLDGSQNATLYDNRITNNSWHGVNSIGSQSLSTRNIISDNGASSDFSGLRIHDSGSQIIENYVANNRGNAILFEESTGEILNNSLIGNNIGISLRRSSPTIRDNNPIESNYFGIHVNQSSPVIEGNLLDDNRYGVYSVDSSGLVIDDNIITNSVGKDMLVGNEEGNIIQFTGPGGPFFNQLGSLRTTDQAKIDVDLSAVPTTVDMDGDGRLDLVIGNEHGFFYYYRNTGDDYEYLGRLSNVTPLMNIDVGTHSHPFVIDWDSDGDLDLLVGQGDGRISYFKNDGANVFSFQAHLSGIVPGTMASPYFVDWVGLSYIDLLGGSGDGYLRSYLGTGPLGSTSFTFSEALKTNSSFIVAESNSTPVITHWNNNTLLDLIFGDGQGNLTYYERTSSGTFELKGLIRLTKNGSDLRISKNAVPALEDWNRDGYLDLVLGGNDGHVYYCENAGDNTFRDPVNFREGGVNLSVGNWSAPFVVDWDGDGVYDLVVGDAEGYLTLFLGIETANVTLQPGQRLQTRGPRTYISVGGWSAPAMLDWNGDGDSDLIAGGQDGLISYYENVGSNEFIFQWNLSSNSSEVDVGLRSAPRIVDWDSNGTNDILIGSHDGFIYRFERIADDLRNISYVGLLDADGSPIQVAQRSVPCAIDADHDGDLDLFVGNNSGKITWFQNNNGQLHNLGYLKTGAQDLTVDGFSAPLALGWESSSDNPATRNGIFFENSTALIINNEVIRGGGGGFAIRASNSTISLQDNGWVAGGKGLDGGGSPSKSSPGGHGILANDSSVFISNTPIRGGDGSDSSALKQEGGDGGIGIEIVDCTLKVLNSSMIGGAGRRGILTSGIDGVGLLIDGSQDAFLDSTIVRGGTAIRTSDSDVHVRNGKVASEQYDFDLGNASQAVSMNTTLDRSKVIFRDTVSTLTVGWHIHASVIDSVSTPVPKTELTIFPATYTNRGDLGILVSGPASPTIANLSSPSNIDLLIGDANGNVQFYTWNGGQFFSNGTVNLSVGGPVVDWGPCSPDFADWDDDGDLDLFLGTGMGSILLFNNTGNGTFDTGYPLNLTGGSPINISAPVVPSVVDWNGDGRLDVIAGGDGYTHYFENDGSGYFLPGRRVQADGSDIKHGSWSSPEVSDFDGDGRLDLLIGTEDGRVALYLNNTFNQLAFAGYLKTNNSLLGNIDIGYRSVVTLSDLDGDGHSDMLVGNSDGEMRWFRSNRYAGEAIAYTDAYGKATEIPVIEYIQTDSTGDNDGEDDGERLYLSPSGFLAYRCGAIGNIAPLPHVAQSLSVVISVNIDLGNCPPIVQFTFPFQNQDNVPVSSALDIVFDKDMDRLSVETSVFFNPSLSVTPNWISDRHVELDPAGMMDFSNNYTLTLSGNIARDSSGTFLDGNDDGISGDDFTLQFRTEPIPQVISHFPDGAGQSVGSIISICFNKAMNESSVEQYLSVTPAMESWIWWKTNGSCIYVDAELEPGTTYTVSIWGDATDDNGNTLDGNGNGVLQGGFADRYEWQFTTVADPTPPSVVSTLPVDGQANVGLTPDITVNFTKPIDYESLETGLSISSNGVTWGEGTGPGFVPVHDFGLLSIEGSSLKMDHVVLQFDTEYQITLSGDLSNGILDLDGNALDGNANGAMDGSPDDDYSFTFSTIDPIPPRVVFTYPADGDENIPLRPIIRAVFDEGMDPSSLNSLNVSLNGPEGVIQSTISYLSSNNTLLLEPNADLKYNSNHTVTISSQVRDLSQNLLDGDGDGIGTGTPADDYIWIFKTVQDTVRPIVNIIAPLNGTIFITGDLVRVNGTAYDSNGIDDLEIRIHSGDWIDITSSYNSTDQTWFYDWDTEDLDGGVFLIRVRVSDIAGLDSTDDRVVELTRPISAYPVWIPILLTIVILIGATVGYRYYRSTFAERERVVEQRRVEMEEMLRRIEKDQETLVKRAAEIDEKELDLDAKEDYLRTLDAQYASMAESLFKEEKIDLAMGESVVEQEMGENVHEVKRYEKAFTLLSEAEASEAGEITKKLPESGKKAMLLVYFNALEAYLREKLQEMIPRGATILLGEKGHINTRLRGWDEKWAMLSLGTLTHAIDHNKHFFVEDKEAWEEVKGFLRETVEIRNLTAHPSETNPEVSEVRKRVYSAILSLSSVLKRPREVKR